MTAPNSARDTAFDPELSYPDWLLGHDDASLAALLRRLHERGAIDLVAPAPLSELGATSRGAGARIAGGAGYESGYDAAGSPAPAGALDDTLLDSASLRFLSAIELLVLHSGYEMDATHQWVTASDIIATAEELLDIAGTPEQRRPSEAELLAAMRSCASWGFLYGSQWSLGGEAEDAAAEQSGNAGEKTPSATNEDQSGEALEIDELMLKLPPPLSTMFHPSVKELWRLGDCNRCPIPTADLPAAIEELPDRQRRLLTTLNNAGGVGHSESLRPEADPDQPLPTLVRSGILDQLDDNTARLTGRVAQYLRGTLIGEPGGDFRPVIAPADLPSPTAEPGRNTSATAVANVIQTIQDLSELLEELGREPIQPLMSGGIGIREMGRIARRWGTESDEIGRRLTLAYEAGLVDLGFAHPPAGDGPVWAPTELALDFLESPLATQWAILLLGWQASPYAPWRAEELDVRAFQDELDDPNAANLRGLFPSLFRTPTGATTSTEDIPDQLWRVQPYQAWCTTSEGLAAIVQESVDFGLTALGEPTAALSALRDAPAGEPGLEPLAQALKELLPAPVEYLIIQGDHTVMAPGLLAPEDAAVLRAIAVQESSGMASVWRITKASLQSALIHSYTAEQISEFLGKMTPGGLDGVPQSIRYLIEDAERGLKLAGEAPGAAEDGATGSKAPHRVNGRARRRPTKEQIDEAIAAEIESYRRLAEDSEQAHEGDEIALTDPTAALNALRQAYTSGHQVRLTYAEADGSTVTTWISVVMVTASQITAVAEPEGETFTVHPHRVVAVYVPSR